MQREKGKKLQGLRPVFRYAVSMAVGVSGPAAFDGFAASRFAVSGFQWLTPFESFTFL